MGTASRELEKRGKQRCHHVSDFSKTAKARDRSSKKAWQLCVAPLLHLTPLKGAGRYWCVRHSALRLRRRLGHSAPLEGCDYRDKCDRVRFENIVVRVAPGHGEGWRWRHPGSGRCSRHYCAACPDPMLSSSFRMIASPEMIWPAASWASLRARDSSHPAGAGSSSVCRHSGTLGGWCADFQSHFG